MLNTKRHINRIIYVFFSINVNCVNHDITQLTSYVQMPCFQIQSETLGFWHPEALFSNLLRAHEVSTAHELSNVKSMQRVKSRATTCALKYPPTHGCLPHNVEWSWIFMRTLHIVIKISMNNGHPITWQYISITKHSDHVMTRSSIF